MNYKHGLAAVGLVLLGYVLSNTINNIPIINKIPVLPALFPKMGA
jgi:hypothetical protein